MVFLVLLLIIAYDRNHSRKCTNLFVTCITSHDKILYDILVIAQNMICFLSKLNIETSNIYFMDYHNTFKKRKETKKCGHNANYFSDGPNVNPPLQFVCEMQ